MAPSSGLSSLSSLRISSLLPPYLSFEFLGSPSLVRSGQDMTSY
ncbi:uncharacterized protein G2W53_001416 [Senna tora]|uniref:Uncharacterized protein n=1 Tax=Senna tora TaxID=362788 RepID=A0A835CIK0_9FABA|nr:uncharacterized protein G2W53_001416 [Senna tora]